MFRLTLRSLVILGLVALVASALGVAHAASLGVSSDSLDTWTKASPWPP